MKIKSGFIVSKIGGETVAVPSGKLSLEFDKIITLTESGEFLWKKLNEDTDEEKLVSALLDEYDVTYDVAKRDVSAFVQKLKDTGILEY